MNITINKLQYKVKFVDRISVDTDNSCIGWFDGETQIIEIKKSLSKLQLRRTFLHELTHAFVWAYGFNDVDFNKETISNFVSNYFDEMQKILKMFDTIYNK